MLLPGGKCRTDRYYEQPVAFQMSGGRVGVRIKSIHSASQMSPRLRRERLAQSDRSQSTLGRG